MRKLWVVSIIILGAAVGVAEEQCLDGIDGSSNNIIMEPDYVTPKAIGTEKEQYVPVLEDDPPVKDRKVIREITDGLIIEEGKESVIDPESDFTPTREEITEESD